MDKREKIGNIIYRVLSEINIRENKAYITDMVSQKLIDEGYRKLPEDIHLKLMEWEGKPAIEFDDGDVFYQSQTIGEFLMHLSILMPECELPDDIYIRKLQEG